MNPTPPSPASPGNSPASNPSPQQKERREPEAAPAGSGTPNAKSAAEKPLTVVARFKSKPGQENALRQELLALIPITRQEPGCLNYDLHEAPDQPGLFLFHENWTSQQHLDDHLARPHLTAFLGKADALLAEPAEITLWRGIG